jgi:hypothetical protein
MRRMSWRAPSFLRPCQTVRRPKLNPTPRRALCILHTIREYQGLPRRGAYLPSSRFRADDLELESPEMLTRRGVAGLISNGGPHCVQGGAKIIRRRLMTKPRLRTALRVVIENVDDCL